MDNNPKKFTGRAIVHTLMEYRESDMLVGLITREHGPMNAVARHAKKSIKRFGARLDLMNVVNATLSMAKAVKSNLWRLDSTELLEPFVQISNSPEKLASGQVALDTAAAFWGEGDAQTKLYDLLEEYLGELDAGKVGRNELLFVMLKILGHHGYSPVLDACSKCGASLEKANRAGFSPMSGGVICPKCMGPDHQRISIEPFKALSAGRNLPVGKMGRIKISREASKHAWQIVTGFTRYVAQKDIKSLKFLENLSGFESLNNKV